MGGKSGAGLTRAKDIQLDLWDRLQLKMNSRHVGVALTRRRRHPVGGFVHLGFATNFLLGEIELALLDLHSDAISFGVLPSTVTLPLSASKCDPTGRTAARTHKCRCDKLRWVSCPFCSASFLVKQTAEDWNSFDGSGGSFSCGGKIIATHRLLCRLPLFVEKAHMDHALHPDASFFSGSQWCEVRHFARHWT